MELRHLHRFLTLAEELHFSRAAERLHIEQPPLSRAITELEQNLGVKLFERTRRGTRLTFSGQVFLEDVPRIFVALDQAISNVRAAEQGYHRTLRIAVSAPLPPTPLASFLARCREEEPETNIRIFETSSPQQLRGLRDALYDIGLARSSSVDDGFVALPIWEESMYLAVSVRHPLLTYKEVPLPLAMGYRLIIMDEKVHEGTFTQVEQALTMLQCPPAIVERVTSTDLMMTLVAAGYGVAFIGEYQANSCKYEGVIARPISDPCPRLTTYLLRPSEVHTDPLQRLIDRLSPAPEATEDDV
ncbi:LysR family transcriptional regulator [Pseudomonas sp. SWI44]|uniref:LysR family transcriptional regulator n=1 Tax=Pseudomonas sp. SWI44 TaxID=2083053 RepID=UPI000CE5F01F|nr:LysR family transcriptional regulator [Pseudomonas sp. SWI44]AVD90038.1 LysR family transcriptional regulator [Pseudomonas sp. SWI44]